MEKLDYVIPFDSNQVYDLIYDGSKSVENATTGEFVKVLNEDIFEVNYFQTK